MLNPTASSEVVSLSALTPAGYTAPLPFQGVVVGPHAEVALDLGRQIVNLASVAPTLTVARGGRVVATAVETWATSSHGASLVAGWPGSAERLTFPDVPTNGASAVTLAVANTSSSPAHLTVDVTLSPYQVSPFEFDVPANSIDSVPISPTSRVPAAGAATLRVHASVPVIATAVLFAAHSSGVWIVSPSVFARTQIVDDIGGGGLSEGTLVATSTGATVTITSHGPSAGGSQTVTISPSSIKSLSRRDLHGFAGGFTVLSADQPVAFAATGVGLVSRVAIVGTSGGR
jgi:hypothetical protein